MTIRCLRAAAALVLFAIAPLAGAQTKLLRFPDICNDRVVFTYGGDLWTVSAQGGTAIRLTAGPGLQQSAKFSPVKFFALPLLKFRSRESRERILASMRRQSAEHFHRARR